MRKPLIFGMLLAVTFVCRAAADEPLVAHEWGTFTALQDDDGTAIGAINADDEPVPDFVCHAGFVQIAKPRSQLTPVLEGGKGLAPCHPGVTMRLETPVIYFYPPDKGSVGPVNVRVTFHGGWLTEFYPNAAVDAPDLVNSQVNYPPLSATTNGSLAWNNVRLGTSGNLTPTDDPVWTAPREVARAATVTVPSPTMTAVHQSEKFLFYRGVGHRDSPLHIVRDPNTDRLNLFADASANNLPSDIPEATNLLVPAAWLIEIRPEDGSCAFRPITGAMDLHTLRNYPVASLPASFAPAEFGAQRLQELRGQMHAALVSEGLFPDEAAAMLKTWELSYFKSPGRRLFYIVPRAWTDKVLPLSIEGATVVRAMIGRIELVSPAQHALLARIAAGPCPDMATFSRQCWDGINAKAMLYSDARNKKTAAALPPWRPPTLAEMNVAVPAIYQDYLNLGRFRDALVLHEQASHPTPALKTFLVGNGLLTREADQPLTLSSFLPGDEHAR